MPATDLLQLARGLGPPWLVMTRRFANSTISRQHAFGGLSRSNLKAARADQIRLQPVIAAAKTMKRHKNDILKMFYTDIANELCEGINSPVPAAKAKAGGYRSTHNLKAIISLIAKKPKRILPT